MISHSKFWKDTAVFVVEDDTQDGVDHVDGHRNVALVASPYAKPGVVDTYYSQLNIVRTIEQILGLPPMNQLDMAAVPMSDAFTETPNFTPYNALPNSIPLDTLVPAASTLTGPAKAWAQWAAQQNFTSEDLVNTAQLNRDIWYGAHDFASRIPATRAFCCRARSLASPPHARRYRMRRGSPTACVRQTGEDLRAAAVLAGSCKPRDATLRNAGRDALTFLALRSAVVGGAVQRRPSHRPAPDPDRRGAAGRSAPGLMPHPFCVGRMSATPKKIDPELKARAVRLVNDHAGEYPSQTAASVAVTKQLGVGKESVRRWVVQEQVHGGQRSGALSEELAEIKTLKTKVRRLEADNAILKAATSFFVGELDPRNR